MKKSIFTTLQLAAVFIGTIVGAGLASGEEITLFFTRYGYKSFYGLIICFLIYILMGFFTVNISVKYKLNSYNEFIKLVSPGFLGFLIDKLTGLFLLSGASIILAASGALFNQYFHISKWFGITLMLLISLYTLMRNTEGLIEINSFIVPSLITIITTIFILYILFSKDMVNSSYIKSIPNFKTNWVGSTLLYAGFNILSCSGVLVPLSSELKDRNTLQWGVFLGATILTIIAFMLNSMLLLNVPYIFKYDIPLLYIANRFGFFIQILLLMVMWLEMFSTEVSDVYSLGKTISHVLNISYEKSVILVLLLAVPISQFGFVNLITYIYPAFGFVSIVFMLQCGVFYYKNDFKKIKNNI
jgi:uncharacterized membrane protein YkvI